MLLKQEVLLFHISDWVLQWCLNACCCCWIRLVSSLADHTDKRVASSLLLCTSFLIFRNSLTLITYLLCSVHNPLLYVTWVFAHINQICIAKACDPVCWEWLDWTQGSGADVERLGISSQQIKSWTPPAILSFLFYLWGQSVWNRSFSPGVGFREHHLYSNSKKWFWQEQFIEHDTAPQGG